MRARRGSAVPWGAMVGGARSWWVVTMGCVWLIACAPPCVDDGLHAKQGGAAARRRRLAAAARARARAQQQRRAPTRPERRPEDHDRWVGEQHGRPDERQHERRERHERHKQHGRSGLRRRADERRTRATRTAAGAARNVRTFSGAWPRMIARRSTVTRPACACRTSATTAYTPRPASCTSIVERCAGQPAGSASRARTRATARRGTASTTPASCPRTARTRC